MLCCGSDDKLRKDNEQLKLRVTEYCQQISSLQSQIQTQELQFRVLKQKHEELEKFDVELENQNKQIRDIYSRLSEKFEEQLSQIQELEEESMFAAKEKSDLKEELRQVEQQLQEEIQAKADTRVQSMPEPQPQSNSEVCELKSHIKICISYAEMLHRSVENQAMQIGMNEQREFRAVYNLYKKSMALSQGSSYYESIQRVERLTDLINKNPESKGGRENFRILEEKVKILEQENSLLNERISNFQTLKQLFQRQERAIREYENQIEAKNDAVHSLKSQLERMESEFEQKKKEEYIEEYGHKREFLKFFQVKEPNPGGLEFLKVGKLYQPQ